MGYKVKEEAAEYGSSNFDIDITKHSIEELIFLKQDVEDMIKIKEGLESIEKYGSISYEEFKKRSSKWLKN